MTRQRYLSRYLMPLLLLFLAITVAAPAVAAEPHPYEATSSGYFRDQDTLPGAYRLFQQSQDGKGSLWGIGPGGGKLSRTSFSTDAHENESGYGFQSCVSCHQDQQYSLHSTRGNVTCVQCHRDQPIAGIQHYYSSMNPTRRHAYVCAKCHEGASVSFASYIIHEPPPMASATKDEFPLFYYGVWFMAILAVGIFAIFIPYVTLWGIRELIGLFRGEQSHG